MTQVAVLWDICLFSDARISFEVFLPILQTISRNKEQNRPDEFIDCFKMFDNDQNGFITSAELRHILTCLGKNVYIISTFAMLNRLEPYIIILNDKQCRSKLVGFFRGQLLSIYTVCKAEHNTLVQ